MAYVSTSTASASIAGWTDINAKWGDSEGDPQVARFSVNFSSAAATATIGVALVDQNNYPVIYIEGYAKAGARRQNATNAASGNYMGAIDFSSTTAPTAYASSAVSKIDLMHGTAEDYGLTGSGPLKWRFGVTAISAGTVEVSVTTARVI